jgi:hypothetical protein
MPLWTPLSRDQIPSDLYDFPLRHGFNEVDSLVIDLAYFVVWSGTYAPQYGVPTRHVYQLKHRLGGDSCRSIASK